MFFGGEKQENRYVAITIQLIVVNASFILGEVAGRQAVI